MSSVPPKKLRIMQEIEELKQDIIKLESFNFLSKDELIAIKKEKIRRLEEEIR